MSATGILQVFHCGAAPDDPFQLGTRELDWHRHEYGQFFGVDCGLVQVHTRQGAWLLPPHRAGWIPAGVEHRVSLRGALSGWGVLLSEAGGACLPAQPCVLAVGELLRALVRRAAGWTGDAAARQRLLAVLLDELSVAPHEALHLPLPRDARLLKLARRVLERPGEGETLEGLCARAGLSARSARRLFQAEVGMNFQHWRRQVQLSQALERLAGGATVAQVADELGYAAPSQFITMFRRALGATPGRYLTAATSTRPGS